MSTIFSETRSNFCQAHCNDQLLSLVHWSVPFLLTMYLNVS